MSVQVTLAGEVITAVVAEGMSPAAVAAAIGVHDGSEGAHANIRALIPPAPIGSVIEAFSNPDATKYIEMAGQWVARSAWPALSALVPNHQPFAPWHKTPAAITGLGGTLGRIVYNGSIYCALASGTSNNVYTSPDGLTWTLQAGVLPASLNAWSGLAWNGTVFCAMAKTSVATTVAATSPDGVVWTLQTLPASVIWYDIISNGTTFCIIGAARVATSPDGVVWTLGTGIPSSFASWYNLACSGPLYLATTQSNNAAVSYTSPDGLTWTAHDLTVENYEITGAFGATPGTLMWDGGKFVSVGTGGMASSIDGITWQLVTLGKTLPSTMSPIIYDPVNHYYAVSGASQRLAILSTDGYGWFDVPTTPISDSWPNGGFCAGRFVFAGNDGDIMLSAYSSTQIYLPASRAAMQGARRYLRAAA